MKIQRLGWAGVEIEADGRALVIDYVQDQRPLEPVLRSQEEPFPASSRPGDTSVALLTHLHADHADADALAVALRPGAPVFRPEQAFGSAEDRFLTEYAEQKFDRRALATQVIAPWASREVDGFLVSAVPAVDGFGDLQVTWIVERDGCRILHAGDTLFHGLWWRIAHRHGPFDVAFLPVNAPVCTWPHLQPPSPVEATLTPEEAAVAAHILGAKRVVPIHYGSLNKAGQYEETPHPVDRLETKCKELGIDVSPLEPGLWFNVA